MLGKGESEEVMVCGRTWLLMDGRRWWRIDDEVIGERERERERWLGVEVIVWDTELAVLFFYGCFRNLQ